MRRSPVTVGSTVPVRLGLLATVLGVTTSCALVAPVASAYATPQAGGNVADWQKGQWWIDATRLRERHDQGLTGKGVDIALIDGPVTSTIPELQGQDVRPTLSTCDESSASDGPLSPDVPLGDASFHTTSMAALIVGNGRGTGPGGGGVVGVAPGATLRTYAIFNTTDPAKHQNLMCDLAAMPGLVDRVVADGADIIEIPVTLQGFTPKFTAAVNRAVAKGVILVAGAGNGGPGTNPMPPADQQGVLVVGGVDRSGQVSAQSPTSVSSSWDVAQLRSAPTSDIHLLAPANDIIGGGLAAGRWESDVLQNGTSGSSAIVAGQLALMKQRWPTATGNQLLYSLLRNANRSAGSPPWDPRSGYGTTSFERTLTTDPTAYPDVHPFYGHPGNVYSDHPVAPFIPVAVDTDGHLPQAPASSPGPGTTAPGGPTTGQAPANEAAPQAASTAADAGGTPGAWTATVILGCLVALGAAAVLRNRRSAGRTRVSKTAAEGKDSR